MTLPSQAARSHSTARTFTRSRRRRRGGRQGPLLLIAVVVVIAVVGAWVLVGQGEFFPGDAGSGEANEGSSERAAAPGGDDALATPVSERYGTLADGDQDAAASNRTGGPPPSGDADDVVAAPAGRNLNARRERGGSSSPLAAALDAQASPEREARAEPTSAEAEAPAPRLQPDAAVAQALEAANAEVQRGQPGAARRILESVLTQEVSEDSATRVREALSLLNATLLFGPTMFADEPLTRSYEIQPGDSLSRIASRESLGVDWRLVQRINRIANPSRIRVGQQIKLIEGPFHAVVTKSAYRLDLYQGPAEDQSRWRYILSAPVGLGEQGSTPTGSFAVKPNSRLINPHWVNPRTGERFDADNPENPIGERWIGIEGLGADAIKTGYGLHGTIAPDSIGRQESMGCVRLSESDVELLYELLLPGSLVTIVE